LKSHLQIAAMAGRFFIFPICVRGAKERDIAIEWLNYSKTSASDLLAKIFNYRHCEFGRIFLSYFFVVILKTIVSGDVMWGLTSIQSQ